MIVLVLAMLLGMGGPSWELVGVIGPFKTVYVTPELVVRTPENGIRLVKISVEIVKRFDVPCVVEFFDDRLMTPTAIPYTTEQREHLKARVAFPAKGKMTFEWYPPEDKQEAKK